MENKNILLGAVLILLIALVTFNLDITGEITKPTITKITVQPTTVQQGDKITITVTPGEKGANRNLYFMVGNYRRLISNLFCRESGLSTGRCLKPETMTFVIPVSWKPDIYSVAVYDFGIKDYVRADFTVTQNPKLVHPNW
jgi:hypothetical protein